MKKRLASLLFFTLAGVWIYFTIRPMTPNSLGELMTWRTGMWSLQSPESLKQEDLTFSDRGYQVEINIDSFGIPHIYGQSEFDVYFGLGLMHARDRYFQMELITRSVEGRLSELAGTATAERRVPQWRFLPVHSTDLLHCE